MNEWRNIAGYDGHYQVSETGQVKSLKRGGKLLSLVIGERGYVQVNLYWEGRARSFLVHRLVGAAFLGRVEGYEVNHIDGVKTHNAVENLEIVTTEENRRHALVLKQAKIPRFGSLRRRSRHGCTFSMLLRGGQRWVGPTHGVHGSRPCLPGGSRRRGGSEHPDSDFKKDGLSTATRPPTGRRSAGAGSIPANDRSTAGRYARPGRAGAQRR